jgi:Putative Ig domain
MKGAGLALYLVACAGIVSLLGCGGGNSNPITIEIVPPSTGTSVDVGSTQALTFTALLGADIKNKGVTWKLTGTSCSGTGCGTLSNATPLSVVYTAPTVLPSAAALSVTLTATSVATTSVTQTATITVEPVPTFATTNCNPPGVLPCVLPNGANGVAYSTIISFTGGVSPYIFNMPILPAGLQLVTTTTGTSATISGRPSGSGTTTFTVTLTDSGGAPAVSQAFSITVTAAPTLSIITGSLPPGTLNATYTSSIATQGGVAPLAWSVTTGTLPPGLVLNSSNGQITGIPTTQPVSYPAAYPFTVQVKDSALPASQVVTQALTITIEKPAILSISTQSLPAGMTATGYSASLQATGGVSPYTWSLTEGQLPAGLVLNSAGTITGTPVLVGTSTFTVQVADSEVNTSGPNPMTAKAQFTITVSAGPINNKLLFNGYSFLFTGFDKDGSIAIAGFLTADGNGNITSGSEDITRVSSIVTGASVTGTYTIDSNGDGHGTMELVATIGQNTLTTDYRLVLASNGVVRFFEDKPASTNGDTLQTHGEGVMKPIVGSSFGVANFSGHYAFELAGQDLTQKSAALAGTINADGSSALTPGSSDFNDAGTFSSGSLSGSFTFIAGNRGTASLTFPLPSGQATLNFVYYFVSPSDLYLVEVDTKTNTNTPSEFRLAGEMILQQPTTVFNSNVLQGVSVASGIGLNGGNSDVFAGLLTATSCDGSTAITLAYDENNGGTITSPSFSGTCSIATNGRAAFAGLGTSAAATRVAVAYLTGPGQGFLLGSDAAVTAGLLEQQSGGPAFTDASVVDGYTLSAPLIAETDVKNVIGQVTADGNGNISGSVDEIDPPATAAPNLNQALTASFTSPLSSARGALTASGTAPNGFPASAIFYIVSPGSIRLISDVAGDQHPELIFLDH